MKLFSFPHILIILTLFLVGCSDNDKNSSDDSGSQASAACDATPEILQTSGGIEFVRTPDSCFEDLQDFPYSSKYVEIDGLRQAYVEEGPSDGEVVLLLHGQPSWSYLYRKMIPVLAENGYRVIAMDHLGLGRSDKPTDIDDYTYLGHYDRLVSFIEALELRDINLFAQDWGSLIGLRVAGLNPEWFASIAVGNGSLPNIPAGVELFPAVENPNEIADIPSPFADMPDQQVDFYDGCDFLLPREDNSYFGNWMEYAMKGAAFSASEVLEANTWFPLSEDVEAAYDAPFPSRTYMAGIRKFPSIANELGGLNEAAVAGLFAYQNPFLTIWASNDAGQMGGCDAQNFFIDNVPGAAGQAHTRLPESSHFLQDDQGEEIALRLVDFYENNRATEPEVGFEILQVVSESEVIVWINADMTQAEFDAIELPSGWIKNQPREGDASEGSFSRSPNANADGPLTEQELFGHSWRHNATIIETGISMDDQGLLNAAYVAKYHDLTYGTETPIFILVAPDGEQYIRVSRDAGRTSEVPSVPSGWQLLELTINEPLVLTLPNPTLNIRGNNEDSFQGPIETIDLTDAVAVVNPGVSAPLELTQSLCEDPNNMSTLLASDNWQSFIAASQFNQEQVQRMVSSPTDGPFYMLNLITYRELAEYKDGRETDLTGREANALYAPAEFLAAIGAGPVFSTTVGNQIDGDDYIWDDVAIVEYPCPTAFFAMLLHPEFQARAIHKDAGVEKTIIMVTDLEPSLLPPDFEPPVSPYPATEEDPAFELIHVMDFHDIAQYEDDANEPERTGAEAWDMYESGGSSAGVEIGSYPTARFSVQGVLSGDDRGWDEVHINHMPSMAGFEALLANGTRQDGRYHRYAALANNYSMITFPSLNELLETSNSGGEGQLPITQYGVGTPCSTDADCVGIGTCLSDGTSLGFCTRQCGSGECGDPYVCCHSCSELVAPQLPFNGSACLVSEITEQLTASPASCTCN